MKKEELIEFEKSIACEWELGNLPFLLHLCGGNEDYLCKLFQFIKKGDYVLSSHRNHYHYLLHGGDPQRLRELIRNGRSMFVFDKSIRFLCSSVLAGTCGIAAGLALGLQLNGSSNSVWCFLGDGAEDEGHFYEAVRFVEGSHLPCTFIIEDNNRSVDCDKDTRGAATVIQAECVKHYSYTPTYPHAGSGCKSKIVFNPEVVSRFDRRG